MKTTLIATAVVALMAATSATAGGFDIAFAESSYGGEVGANWGSKSVAVGNGLNLSFGAAHSEGYSGAQSCFRRCGGTGSGYAGGKSVTGSGSLSLGNATGMGFGEAGGGAGASWFGGSVRFGQ